MKTTTSDAKAMLSKISLQIKKIEVKNDINLSATNMKIDSIPNPNKDILHE